MATRKGLEPSTSSVTGWHSNRLNYRATFYEIGGNNRARTCDPLLVRQMLSQLSYAPRLGTAASLDCVERGDEIYNTRWQGFCQLFFQTSLKKIYSPAKTTQYLKKITEHRKPSHGAPRNAFQ